MGGSGSSGRRSVEDCGRRRAPRSGEETTRGGGGFAAREVGLHRERDALLRRLSRLGPRVLDDPDLDAVCADLRRLLVDVTHHVQRRHDLAYDEVELELGGSE